MTAEEQEAWEITVQRLKDWADVYPSGQRAAILAADRELKIRRAFCTTLNNLDYDEIDTGALEPLYEAMQKELQDGP